MAAEIEGKARQKGSVDRVSEGAKVKMKLFRDGTISQEAMIQGLIYEGLGYSAFEGAFSTPAVGGGAAAIIDIDRPNMTLGVPDATTILLYAVYAQAQVPLLATDSDESEILLGVHVGTSIAVAAATSVTPRNLLTGVANGSLIDAEITHATNITTAPTVDMELKHAVIIGDVQTTVGTTWGSLEMNYEPRYVTPVKGPGTVLFYRGGTVATTGFTQMYWVEVPTSFFN
ncbi:hypothetical protein LCGC14_1202440 [marine sediment metagenome]|uniref:Uncharacterized protein n=1 Tax=marine sediment metagenome TaxID=412755 RepID=A0A0F9M3S3_9ZZZZ